MSFQAKSSIRFTPTTERLCYTLRIKTKIVGMYDVGIPQVVAYMPDRDEVELWRDARSGIFGADDAEA